MIGRCSYYYRASFSCATRLNFSTCSLTKSVCIHDEDCGDFLPWLRRKSGTDISSFLSIGNSSTYGRYLFASKCIYTGDSILKVPCSVQLSPDNLVPQIKSLLKDEVSDNAKLAVVILVEQKLGQDSEWAPYISRLPRLGELNSTIFWSNDDLEMIEKSSIYEETIRHNIQIEEDFLALKPALQHFPSFFQEVTLKEFRHAYGLVSSRAWTSMKGVSMIPFADFLNHDGISEADVLCDETKQLSEVIADRDYAPGDQVMIRYGKFSNRTLLLDFGFTLADNVYEQIKLDIPHHDPLRSMKMDLLCQHSTPVLEDDNAFSSCGNSFMIKQVKLGSRKGRGIPQALRAFARVICSTSSQELSDLAIEAAKTDGRLARQPLQDKDKELQAHQFLLSRINQLIENHDVAMESLAVPSSPCMSNKHSLRRKLARDLLNGELVVLKSAGAWLKNYCDSL
ncbi:ribosomal lysine N-methyltransferase 4 isoform X2 [Daucus carota subsp. sativus]|uniref:ribosomal lysine N-methyltransferase 4 isoform X2 n=1 Tax=Daucus carota subsp. sativus TaxID=79200 RepID=UPI0007EF8489|nr:PREDICTED: ribosomal lysine N-methyltransferase 4 isoform X2 [Daucus carota subsp. sativus]